MRKISEIFIRITSNLVGTDEFGNQYFENKTKKRFVIYKGIVEPTRIPAEWHGWIHHSYTELPSSAKRYSWQKIHIPNLTGTKNANFPKNFPSSKTRSTYNIWTPSSNSNYKI